MQECGMLVADGEVWWLFFLLFLPCRYEQPADAAFIVSFVFYKIETLQRKLSSGKLEFSWIFFFFARVGGGGCWLV